MTFISFTDTMCINSSSSSQIFISDLPSYGLIGLILIAFLMYIFYIIAYIRNNHSTTSVYIYLSQFSLFFTFTSLTTFLIRPLATPNYVCLGQNLSVQIFPFFLLLGCNLHFIHEWLMKTTKNSGDKLCLITTSTFLIFLLSILFQTSIIILWFYKQQHENLLHCQTECQRPLFLCSLALNFFFLFLLAFQSSLHYHFSNTKSNLIYLLISVLAICVTISWICLYSSVQLRTLFKIEFNNHSIIAYGNIFFVYTFLGPLLFEQLFYSKKVEPHTTKKLTFKCLSLTKEQQRAYMAAYIKRNLTASCENLTTISISSPQSHNRTVPIQTCHSTLSANSLCPTLASTISQDLTSKTSPQETLNSK